MSVNGSGINRQTNKPLSDSTTWTVKEPHGPVLSGGKDRKPLVGLTAADAFAAVASFRRRGIWAVPVRS